MEYLKNVIRLEKFAALACLLMSLCLVVWIGYWARYGFDFTDESFRINWISYAHYYDTSHIQTGYLLHPVYRLLGGELVLVRIFNVVLLAFAGTLCAHAVIGRLVLSEEKRSRLILFATASGFGSAALLQFEDWLLVPGYNSMNLVGLALFVVSLALIERRSISVAMAGWALMGLSGVIVFFSKASSAMLLLPLALLYLAWAGRFNWKGISVAAAVVVIAVSGFAVYVDGSIAKYAARVGRAIEFSQMLGAKRSFAEMFRVDEFNIRRWAVFELLILAACVAAATLLMLAKDRARRYLGVAMVAAILLLVVLVMAKSITVDFRLTRLEEFKILGVPLGVLTGLLFHRLRTTGSQWTFRELALPVCMFFLPFVYSFGTNGNYWEHGYKAALFYVLAGIALAIVLSVKKVALTALLPAALATQLVTASVIQEEMTRPYRQPGPLWQNDVEVAIGPEGSRVMLSSPVARYLTELKTALDEADFEKGTPMIDLTGSYPGTLFAVGALPIGAPWIVGGARGSAQRATATLGRADCEHLGRAWVLLQQDGPRAVPVEMLEAHGLVKSDFVEVVSLAAPPGQFKQDYMQSVWKPKEPEALAKKVCSLRGDKE